MSVKPGYQTTEFWLTAILIAATTLQPYFDKGTIVSNVLIFIVAGMAAAGYSISRAMTKRLK